MILSHLSLLVEATAPPVGSSSPPQVVSAWSWWWTPVIAFLTAVIGTALTHFFTQSRDQSSWLRQRMFDIAQQLADNYNIIVAETYKVPLLEDQPDLSTPNDVMTFLAARDWTALDAGIRGYLVAGNQAKLLDRSTSFHFVVSDATVKAKSFASYTKGEFANWPEESKPGPRGYDARRGQNYAKLRDFHDELMATITTRHFEPKSQKLWSKVTNAPYRIWSRLTRPFDRIRNYGR